MSDHQSLEGTYAEEHSHYDVAGSYSAQDFDVHAGHVVEQGSF